MKKILLSTLALLCAAAFAAEPAMRFSMSPQSPRKIIIGKNNSYKLVAGGECRFDVVIPAKAPAMVREAARELCAILSQQTGSKLAPVAKSSKPFVIELKTALPSQQLDRDGFIIKTAPGKLTITGSIEGRGVLYGVYDFLERFAGVRFYFPGHLGTITPPLKNWSIPEINIIDRPDHQHRKMVWRHCGIWPKDPELDSWYTGKDRKNDLLLHEKHIRMSTNHLPNCHGLAFIDLVKRYAKSNPEFFALHQNGKRMDGTNGLYFDANKYGQLCLSAPKLKDVIFEDIVAVMQGKPAKSRNVSSWQFTQRKPFFNVMFNDGMYFCRCKECWKVFGSNDPKRISNWIWQWKVDLANRMLKEGVPGYLTSMAYIPYREVPDAVRIPKNMVVMLAVHGPWSELDPIARAEETKQIKAWSKKLGAKLYMWNYPTKFVVQMPRIANPTPRAMASFYSRNYSDSFGAFYEGETDCWIFGYLSYYMFGKVLWDHKCDAEALLNEHHRLMFGKGAPEMKEFFDTLERRWVKDLAAHREETAIGPKVVLPSEHKLWNEIYSPKERARLAGLLDKAEKKERGIFAERIRYIRRYFLTPMLKLGAEFERRSAGKENWKAHLPVKKEESNFRIDADPGKAVWKKLQGIHLVDLNNDATDVPTVVKMFQTDKNYYFLFECSEPRIDDMRITERSRDHKRIWSDNAIEIYLDTDGKRESFYQFMINVSGNVGDLKTVPAKHHGDWSFDGKAEVKTRIDKAGKRWIAEVRIPKAAVNAKKNDIIANFSRHRVFKQKEKAKLYTWSCLGKSFGDLANFGQLTAEDPDKGNLLTNGDFVKDPLKVRKSWFNWGGRLQSDTKIYRTGGRSIKMDGGKNINLVHRLNNLKPDTWYVLRYFVKLENIVNPMDRKQHGAFSCRVDDGGFTVKNSVRYLPSPGYTGTMKFQHLEFRFKTASDAGKKHPGILYFCRPKNGGCVWIDHVSLRECKEK